MLGILVATASFELRGGFSVWISSATNRKLKFPGRQIEISSRRTAWIQRYGREDEMEADNSEEYFGKHSGGTKLIAWRRSVLVMKKQHNNSDKAK